MDLRQCILTKNDCYKAGRKIAPRGVMVHSTGANNEMLRRYVQPDDGALGRNPNGNDWNRSGLDVCVHAFIGCLDNMEIATYQTLPWDHRGWHAGGAANNTHISFEICEDGLQDRAYFNKVYREAVELTAYLCDMYKLDPLADGVVICHSEGYERGIASGHADVMHWFPKHGKSMDSFRADVKKEMEGEEMTQEQFNAMLQKALNIEGTGDDHEPWADKAIQFCKEQGIFNGDGAGNYGWKLPITRQQAAQIIYNAMSGK